MILEGRKLGLKFNVLGEASDPACQIADSCFPEVRYKEMVDSSDVVTFEFEHVNERALEYAEGKGKLIPNLRSVELKRHRHREREHLRKLGVPQPRFVIAQGGREALRVLRDQFNGVGVIKKSEGGYDGKNQYYVRGNPSDFSFLEADPGYFVVEELVHFDYEASIVASRGEKAEFYPLTVNRNQKGILVFNYGPLDHEGVREIASKIMDSLDYRGVLAVEFFVKGREVMVNEIAPRVHNTGHYSLDFAETSQFENHIRAITGVPLGSARPLTFFGMVNLLGVSRVSEEVLGLGKVYWYGKGEVRRRRKMGHVNLSGGDLGEVREKIEKVMQLVYGEGGVDNYI